MAASSRRARRGVGAGTSVATGGLSEAAATNDVDVGIDRSAGRSGGARHDPPARRRRGASRSVASGGVVPTFLTAQQTRPSAESTNNVDVGVDRSAGRSGGARRDPPSRRRRGAGRSVAIGGVVPTLLTAQQTRPPAASRSVATGDMPTLLTAQQTRPPAKSTNNADIGSGTSSGGQRVANNALQAQRRTKSRHVRDVHCSCESCTLRSSGAEIAKWKNSEAKDHIRELLLGDKTHSYWKDPPGQVYDDHTRLFHLYKFTNFSTNLRSLRKGISSETEKADFDEIALERELNAFPRGPITSHGNPYYDYSETKKVLVQHAKDGILEQYKNRPRDLKSSNPIFEEFRDEVFPKLVNREKRRVKESVGWQWKRNIQGSMKRNAKHDQMQAQRGGEKDTDTA